MSKGELRRTMLDQLRHLAPSRRAIEEDVVSAAVQASEAWAQAHVVALYKAVAPELSVVGITNAAWKQGKVTVFPRVADTLSWHEVARWDALAPGAFGIPAPMADARRVEPHAIDLWVVPGVAFSEEGNRLGRGGGFFDKALRGRRGTAFGVCFDVQLADVPTEEHDVAVDHVICPRLAGIPLD